MPFVRSRKPRTITLTDQPPVIILEHEWPVIAKGRYYETDAVDITIRVRRHRDGRRLIYGADHKFNRAGYLLDATASASEVVDAIREVGDQLTTAGGADDNDIHAAVRSCIAALPAEVLR